MAWPVVPVASGGIPVTEAAKGTPYDEATNGFGVAVTFGSYGAPVTSLRGTYTSNLNLSNTSNFRSVYRAGVRNTRVAFIGDSTFRGQSFGVGTAQAVNAFPMQL